MANASGPANVAEQQAPHGADYMDDSSDEDRDEYEQGYLYGRYTVLTTLLAIPVVVTACFYVAQMFVSLKDLPILGAVEKHLFELICLDSNFASSPLCLELAHFLKQTKSGKNVFRLNSVGIVQGNHHMGPTIRPCNPGVPSFRLEPHTSGLTGDKFFF
ncbi:hypothetical protein BIW11_07790 [Tropilaelaps mercedesae]|uniref:Uncharacterized protein n=1 Tax=Tropilaelaps mercedesae TaxID=418985 RepID=A0A1V9XSS5_9ACAR|nr:hypothetical protein BIW11_07790 [Tropilaelaps mercedesae]